MKLIYAKFWLKKYIKYNYDKFDEKTFNHKLNWAIINLSHRVCKTHGLRGHNIRQNIRKTLWSYNKTELKYYRPSMMDKIICYIKRIFKRQ
jgi:hypothetical protein